MKIHLKETAVKYKLNRGVVQSIQENTSAFAGIVKTFCQALNWNLLALIVSHLRERIIFGVHQDLVELMKISILNGKGARALHNAGYKTLIDISKANLFDIEKCLTDSISFNVQRRDGESGYDAEQRNKYRLLFVTGQAGLTATEAAKLIIGEARNTIRNEIGIQNIAWSQQTEPTTESNAEIGTRSSTTNTQQQTINKRKISSDNQVATTSKRMNYDKTIRSGSVKSFYNDEKDDFMLTLANRNVEQNHLPPLHIVDVARNADAFNEFGKTMEHVTNCGFALSIAKKDPLNTSKNYRCSITSEFYVYGISMSIQDKNIVYFLALQDDDDGSSVDHSKRLEFLKSILTNRKLTLQVNDAKTQLKTLLQVIPNIYIVNCDLEDPQIAYWLLQPEQEDRTFTKMVRLFSLQFLF